MTSSLRYITIGMFFLSLCTAAEQDYTISNREVFYRLSDSLISAASNDVNSNSSLIVSMPRDTFSSYFQPIFLQSFAARNIPIVQRSDSSHMSLDLSVREATVVYSEVFSESFFGSRKTRRSVTLSATGTLVSAAEGKVLWSKQYVVSFSDTVNFAETENLGSSSPPLTAYVPPELSLFDSILEPAIVTIASGVAIYLFFTIRS